MIEPPTVKCLDCKEPVEGVVYFMGYAPFCADCRREREYQRLLRWHERFGGPAPSRDLKLPGGRPCEVCGRLMSWKGRAGYQTVQVCSWECEGERRNARRRVQHEAKVCANCGETFTPKRSDARTCSDRCRTALNRASRINVSATRGTGKRDTTVAVTDTGPDDRRDKQP
jgi:hypothetical protein